jgi:transposase
VTREDQAQRYQRAQAVLDECATHPLDEHMTDQDGDFYASLVMTAKDAAKRLDIPRYLIHQWHHRGRLELLDLEPDPSTGVPVPYFFLPDIAEQVIALGAGQRPPGPAMPAGPDDLWLDLLAQLPADGRWTRARRTQWLQALTAVMDLLITVSDPIPEAAVPLTLSPKGGEADNGTQQDHAERLMTAAEAAEAFGSTPNTVRSWVKRGWLTGVGLQPSTGGRPAQLFRRDAIAALTQASRPRPTQRRMNPPRALMIETVLEILTDVGTPLQRDALVTQVQARAGKGTVDGLRMALEKELSAAQPRLLKVAPATYGLVGRDSCRDDPSQRPRPSTQGPRQPPKDKQGRYRHRRREAGQCDRCGEPCAPYAQCARHRAERRLAQHQQPRLVPVPSREDRDEDVDIPETPGERECLRCDQPFRSPDRVRVRICPTCKQSGDWKMADEL